MGQILTSANERRWSADVSADASRRSDGFRPPRRRSLESPGQIQYFWRPIKSFLSPAFLILSMLYSLHAAPVCFHCIVLNVDHGPWLLTSRLSFVVCGDSPLSMDGRGLYWVYRVPMDGRIGGQRDGLTHGRADGRTGGRADGRTDRHQTRSTMKWLN